MTRKKKNNYIETELSNRKYDYEKDEYPKMEDFLSLIPKCHERFESKRNQLNFSSNTSVLIHLPENKMLLLHPNDSLPEIIPQKNIEKFNQFLLIKTDSRLQLRLMRGPQYAHWNNAEIGSHLEFTRKPNIYERGLFYCLNFFHS